MNILMMTNTYAPHVGGVARSVEGFSAEYRRHGHRVLVIAPEFEDAPEDETNVVRIPAIQNFNGSDFSVVLPIPGYLTAAIERFEPDIVHSHHPFLIGATAQRVAYLNGLPSVFTHHTMYEQYTHYVPGNSRALKRFVIRLSTSYANLCDQVIAPSRSVAATLRERGIKTPIEVVPTGVRLEEFAGGSGKGFRAAVGIPANAFVVGHLGRLTPEKNLEFLITAIARFLKAEPRAHFLIAGQGPSQNSIRRRLAVEGVADRLHMPGQLRQPLLASAYHAMDVFAFASKSETQGMVLTEAMAAGVPVVALDAPGVSEVVEDKENGRLLAMENVTEFAAALRWIAESTPERMGRLRDAATATAENFSMPRAAVAALAVYTRLKDQRPERREADYDMWRNALHRIRAEWGIIKGMANAAGAAFKRDVDNDRM